ncbi:hypothetical protein HID58_031714, partial [Brassica napus]
VRRTLLQDHHKPLRGKLCFQVQNTQSEAENLRYSRSTGSEATGGETGFVSSLTSGREVKDLRKGRVVVVYEVEGDDEFGLNLREESLEGLVVEMMRTLVVDRSTRHGFFLLMPGSLMVTGVLGVLDVTLANDVMFMFLAPFYAARQWCKVLPLQL